MRTSGRTGTVKTILALGNPGKRYADTRHNVGWWLADRLGRIWSFPGFDAAERTARTGGSVDGCPVQLVKPLTYVNRSGTAVEELLHDRTLDPHEDLLVLVDDVSLSPGHFRLRGKGSAGGHNGLASVERALGSQDYCRLRIGVGRPNDDRIDLAEWVLATMSGPEEEEVLVCFDRAVEAVECWIRDGIEAAMNRYN